MTNQSSFDCQLNNYFQLNGKNTLGENIADNGGLHESYNAFKAREAEYGPAPTLADLPKLSGEQLFFISYANVSVHNCIAMICQFLNYFYF